MADREFIVSPVSISITFRLQQAAMLENSLNLMSYSDLSDGHDAWLVDTYKALTDEEQLQHQVVMSAVYDQVVFTDEMTFPDYIEALKAVDPQVIASKSVEWMNDHETLPSVDEAIQDEETYIEVMRGYCEHKSQIKGHDVPFDEPLWRETYRYLQASDELHTLIIDHMTMMWERFLEAEWNKRKPILEESVNAHAKMDYSGMSPYDVIEAVTGRDMRDHFSEMINRSTEMILSPSPHVGPYIGYHEDKVNKRAHLFFRPNLPKGTKDASPALNRTELQVRLSALADDTRLRMMELLLEHEELCAQDFINMLDLSQSSASRHLRQLTASGYIKERRKEVAKCYQLNTDRIEDTLSALRQFLIHS